MKIKGQKKNKATTNRNQGPPIVRIRLKIKEKSKTQGKPEWGLFQSSLDQ
jgi:hypothetical protein